MFSDVDEGWEGSCGATVEDGDPARVMGSPPAGRGICTYHFINIIIKYASGCESYTQNWFETSRRPLRSASPAPWGGLGYQLIRNQGKHKLAEVITRSGKNVEAGLISSGNRCSSHQRNGIPDGNTDVYQTQSVRPRLQWIMAQYVGVKASPGNRRRPLDPSDAINRGNPLRVHLPSPAITRNVRRSDESAPPPSTVCSPVKLAMSLSESAIRSGRWRTGQNVPHRTGNLNREGTKQDGNPVETCTETQSAWLEIGKENFNQLRTDFRLTVKVDETHPEQTLKFSEEISYIFS